MNWFKMIWLNSEEREILRRAKQIKENPIPAPTIDIKSKPFSKVYYSNENITVILDDGAVLSQTGVSQDRFNQVLVSNTKTEIEDILFGINVKQKETVETPEEKELVSRNLDVIRRNSMFKVCGDNVMLKDVNLPMPAPVIASFIELLEKKEAYVEMNGTISVSTLDEQIQALTMFWLKLALNTLPQSREDLLVFCRKNDVRITKNGNLILYRRIVSRSTADKALVTFITQEYYRIKKEGKDPRNFAVSFCGGVYGTVDLEDQDKVGMWKDTLMSNFQVMYEELPTYDTNDFTAHHDRNVNIKLGAVYSIPDSGINLNNSICAAGGLHAAAVNYDYSGFGDVPVVVLVNPSKAITVPMGETGKLRTTEMFVACVNDKPRGIHFDDTALSAFDSEYHDLTINQLEEVAKTKNFESLTVKETLPAVSLIDINSIKEMLKTRINKI